MVSLGNRAALLLGLLLTCNCRVLAAQANANPSSPVDPNAIRLPVGHQHNGGWCLGYLYITPQEIRYEVVRPEKFKSHEFRVSRSQIQAVREWTILGQPQNATEIRFQNQTYHFWLLRPQDVTDGPTYEFGTPNALPFQWLIAVLQASGNPYAQGQTADARVAVPPGGPSDAPSSAPSANPPAVNLPARDSTTVQDPAALIERAQQAMEAYRAYFRRTGDVQNVSKMEPYLNDARTAYEEFKARGDTVHAARSLILATDIERMLVFENVPDYQVKQARIAQDYRAALQLARQANDPALTIKAMRGLLRADLTGKDYAAGARDADELVSLSATSGTKEDLANAYEMRADLERHRGDLSAAADDLTRAVALKDEVHDPALLWSLHSDRSDLYYDRAMKCNYERDFDFCAKALQTALDECSQMIEVAQNAGFTYLAGFSQEHLQQLKLLEQKQKELAGTYRQLSASSFYISKAYQVIHTPHFRRGQDAQMAATLRAYEKQLGGPENNYDPVRYETEGALQEMEGNNDAALQNYLKAVGLLEEDRRRLGPDPGNGQFLNDRISIYYEPAMQYLDRGEYAKAFALLEKSRGRAMADLMYSRQVTLNNPQDQLLFAQSVELDAKLAAAQNKLFNAPATTSQDEVEAMQHSVDELQSQHRALQAKIAEKAPRLHDLVEASPVSLAQAQAAAKRDGYDILYYLALNDGLLIWHIGGDSQHAVKVYYTRSVLIPHVAGLYKSISDPHFTFDENAAKEFWLVLINPVLPYIKTKHLVIIPHEDLNKLPFQVLENPDDSTHLGERFQISYAPSATVLSELGAQPDFSHGKLLAAADPHISSAAAEVTALGTIYPPTRSKIVPGPLVRKQDVMNWSPDYNLLHLSVHGHFDSLDPMLSYLELRPTAEDDGHFTAADMFRLRLPKNSMVVLSACETGRVEATHSNEVLGMVRGLLYAGASDVVLSSWSVDAESTSLWMKTFYREAQTKPPSEAAQLALLAVKNEPQYQHPFYWAPFLLTGR